MVQRFAVAFVVMLAANGASDKSRVPDVSWQAGQHLSALMSEHLDGWTRSLRNKASGIAPIFFQSFLGLPRGGDFFGFLISMNGSPSMLTVFRDAIRWVNDHNLLELRRRFVALDDTARAISIIDSEVAARKGAYYAQSDKPAAQSPAAPTRPSASTAKPKKFVALHLVEGIPEGQESQSVKAPLKHE